MKSEHIIFLVIHTDFHVKYSDAALTNLLPKHCFTPGTPGKLAKLAMVHLAIIKKNHEKLLKELYKEPTAQI